MKLSPFMTQFKKDLEKLNKKQLVKRLLISVEMNANQWNEFDMAYEKLDNEKQICESELIRTEKELEETQEALRRSRKLFESSKEIIDRQLLLIKRLERWITNTWYVADSLEVIKELPGWIEEDMIEYKLFDRDMGKYALLLK